jgi:hypothetical protein
MAHWAQHWATTPLKAGAQAGFQRLGARGVVQTSWLGPNPLDSGDNLPSFGVFAFDSGFFLGFSPLRPEFDSKPQFFEKR